MAGSFAGMSHALMQSRFAGPFHRENGMAENEPWQDPRLPEDARLASLDERLKQAQADEAVRTGKTTTVSNWDGPRGCGSSPS